MENFIFRLNCRRIANRDEKKFAFFSPNEKFEFVLRVAAKIKGRKKKLVSTCEDQKSKEAS